MNNVKDLITVEEIQKNSNYFLQKYKVPILTNKIKEYEFLEFIEQTSEKLSLDYNILRECLMDVYFCIGSVQFEIGFMLSSKEQCKNKKGCIKKITHENVDEPINKELCDFYFWHHYYLSWECIYRVWERVKNLLVLVCYPEMMSNEKNKEGPFYFNKFVEKIKLDKKFSNNPELKNLIKLEKHWNKVSQIRNRYSHQTSKLDVYSLEIKDGDAFEHKPNLIEISKKVRSKYEHLEKLIRTSISFINNLEEI